MIGVLTSKMYNSNESKILIAYIQIAIWVTAGNISNPQTRLKHYVLLQYFSTIAEKWCEMHPGTKRNDWHQPKVDYFCYNTYQSILAKSSALTTFLWKWSLKKTPYNILKLYIFLIYLLCSLVPLDYVLSIPYRSLWMSCYCRNHNIWEQAL